MDIDALRNAILGRSYPELLYGSDPDIERYFELRAAGQSEQALSLYHKRLELKYPEETRRVALLRFFRRRDPRYAPLLRRAAEDLADRLASRIRQRIQALVAPFEGVNMRDAYGLLKAVETALAQLPLDKYEAANALDTYRIYSSLLGFKEREMTRAANLVREYLFEAGPDDETANPDFVERSLRIEEENRAKYRKRHFDLSHIRFSAEELARIEIPARLTRKEDRVLAFCYKYWNLVGDPSFERSLLLYSRKYSSPHYDVYRAIKVGRARRFTDDEILNMASTALASTYSYSVQGDYYMQAVWRRLKAGFARSADTPPAPAVSTPPTAVPQPAQAESIPAREAEPIAKRESTAKRESAAKRKLATPQKGPSQRPTGAAPVPAGGKAAIRRERLRAAPGLRPKAPPAAGDTMAARRESVSEAIRRLSGKSYDVYHDIFLARVRASIRSELSARQTRPHGLFSASLNQAEEAVYRFIERNYDNPFMDWSASAERRDLEEAGFALDSLQPVIEACWAAIREADTSVQG